jgi:outer membrane biosynthesis protein TonB
MAKPHSSENHLRFDRASLDPLARALVISLAIHLLAFGAYKVEQHYHLLAKITLPAWLKKAQQALVVIPPAKLIPPQAPQEPPLMFVEVDPAQAVVEPPKNSKYYSSKSSRAANPDADKDTNTPKISGQQTHVVKTEDTPRTKATPPRPAAPPQPKAEPQPEPQAQPKATHTPGDLAMAKPESRLQPEETPNLNPTVQPKPRTIAEALARQQPNSMAGQKMQQDGGVRHRAIQPSFDVLGSKFGEYDSIIIAAIQSRWYSLLDSQQLTRGTGKVTIEFHLNYDGSVTDIKVLENTVGELLGILCERAIRDPAPFAPWPDDMRRMVGATFREVKFTFYYD